MSLDNWLADYEHRDWQTVTDGTVRYALVGLGWWTTDVALPAIEASSFGETTVLVSRSREKAGRIAAENDISYGITTEAFHDGDAREEYDAVYVCTPNAHHLEYVETAAEYDKGVLCEKPMEATVERAEQMVAACNEADSPLMVAYRMQTDPAVRRARELIWSGFLGEPVFVYGNNTQPLLEMIPNSDQWRLTPGLTGYGTSVMDLGIYSINTTRYLLDRDPVAAQSMMATKHDAFDGLQDERASFLLDFSDGVQMASTASQRGREDTHLKITGTEGQLELHPAFHGECGLRVERGDLAADIDHDEFDAVDEMCEEFDYFADRLLTGNEIYPDGGHGLHDLRAIEAIHEAAETGTTVGITTD